MAVALAAAPARAQDMREQVRAALLAQINADRAQFGLPPVQLEPVASLAAEYHAAEMLAGDYLSHWNEGGLKPYQRYSWFGGYHYSEENVFYYEQQGGVDTSAGGLIQLCLLGEASFMGEQPPNDGHRKSVLNPAHTHVGIGFAASADSFRMVALFTRHLVEDFQPAGRLFNAWQQAQVSGRAPAAYTLQSMSVFYEPWPQAMEIRGTKVARSYGLPQARRDLYPVLPPSWFYADGSRGSITVGADGSFSLPVTFERGPGVYTVVVWLKPGDGRDPVPATEASLFVTP